MTKNVVAPSARRNDLWWNTFLLAVMTYLQVFGYAQLAKPFCAGEPHTLPDSYLSEHYPCKGAIVEKVLYLATRPCQVYLDYLQLQHQDCWVSVSAACMVLRLVLALLWPLSVRFKWMNASHRLLAPLTLLGWVLMNRQEPSALALWFIRSWPLLDCAYVLVFPTTVSLEVVYGVSSFIISALLALNIQSRRLHIVCTLTTCVVSTAWIYYVMICWRKPPEDNACLGTGPCHQGAGSGTSSSGSGDVASLSHADSGSVDELGRGPSPAAKGAVSRDLLKQADVANVPLVLGKPKQKGEQQQRRRRRRSSKTVEKQEQPACELYCTDDSVRCSNGSSEAATGPRAVWAASEPDPAPTSSARQRYHRAPSIDTGFEEEDVGTATGQQWTVHSGAAAVGEEPQQRTVYAPVVRLVRMQLKIHGADPDQVAEGYEERIASVVASAGYELESVYLRRGCIELVINLRAWQDLPGSETTQGISVTTMTATDTEDLVMKHWADEGSGREQPGDSYCDAGALSCRSRSRRPSLCNGDVCRPAWKNAMVFDVRLAAPAAALGSSDGATAVGLGSTSSVLLETPKEVVPLLLSSPTRPASAGRQPLTTASAATRQACPSSDIDIGAIIRALRLDSWQDAEVNLNNASGSIISGETHADHSAVREATEEVRGSNKAWVHPPLLLQRSPLLRAQPDSPELTALFPRSSTEAESGDGNGFRTEATDGEARSPAVIQSTASEVAVPVDDREAVVPEPEQVPLPAGRGPATGLPPSLSSFSALSATAHTMASTIDTVPSTAGKVAAPLPWSIKAHPRILCVAAGSASCSGVRLDGGPIILPKGTVCGPFHLRITTWSSTFWGAHGGAAASTAPTADLQLLLRSRGFYLPARVLQVTPVPMAAVLGPQAPCSCPLPGPVNGFSVFGDERDVSNPACSKEAPEAVCTALQYSLELPYLPARPGLLLVDVIGVATVPVALVREPLVASELQEAINHWEGGADDLDDLLYDISTYVHAFAEEEASMLAAACLVATEESDGRAPDHMPPVQLTRRALNLGYHLLAFSQSNGWNAFSAMLHQQLSAAFPPPLARVPTQVAQGGAAARQQPLGPSSLPSPLLSPLRLPPSYPRAQKGCGTGGSPDRCPAATNILSVAYNATQSAVLRPGGVDCGILQRTTSQERGSGDGCRADDRELSTPMSADKVAAAAVVAPVGLSVATLSPDLRRHDSDGSAVHGVDADVSSSSPGNMTHGWRAAVVAAAVAVKGWFAALLAEAPRGCDLEDFRSYKAFWRVVQAYVSQWMDTILLLVLFARLMREVWLGTAKLEPAIFTAALFVLGTVTGLVSTITWLLLPRDVWMRIVGHCVAMREVTNMLVHLLLGFPQWRPLPCFNQYEEGVGVWLLEGVVLPASSLLSPPAALLVAALRAPLLSRKWIMLASRSELYAEAGRRKAVLRGCGVAGLSVITSLTCHWCLCRSYRRCQRRSARTKLD